LILDNGMCVFYKPPMETPLKLARQRRGWSQAEAAARVGVERTFFGRMERNAVKASTVVARRIAAIFTELTRDQILFPEEYVVDSAGLARPIVPSEQVA
jgi:DNA-binding XRE family transcriptional regulator